jgi:hypothetical protein
METKSGMLHQRRKVSPFKLVMLSMALSLLSAAPRDETFVARLSSVPSDVSTRASVVGTGSLNAVLKGKILEVSGSFQGLVSSATTAQIHESRITGVRGPVIYELTVSHAAAGAISGSLTLTDAQVEGLRKGDLYVQIQSEKTPDGTLWGWFLR